MLNCVIFDLDDTLCDSQGAKKTARAKIAPYLEQIGLDPNAFWANYDRHESDLMRRFLAREITREEYRFHRFHDVLTAGDGDAVALAKTLNQILMEEGNIHVALFDDVIPALEDLRRRKIQRAILTNGPTDGQRRKLHSLGLDAYVSKAYISEEVGFAKPDHRILAYALHDMRLDPQQVLMVGDSIEYDYAVSQPAGVRFVLIDRLKSQAHFNGSKIASLSDLATMI